MMLLIILFVLIILIPLFSNMFIYRRASVSIENEVNHDLEEVMTEMMNRMENILYFNEIMVSNLQSREEVKRLILLNAPSQTNTYDMEIISLQKFLLFNLSYNRNYEAFFIAFPDLDLAISPNYQGTLEKFHDYYYNNSSSLQEWRDSLLQNNYAVCKRSVDGENREVLEFLYQIPLYGQSYIDAMALMRVDCDLFLSAISDVYDSQGAAFYIYDRMGNAVFASQGADLYAAPVIEDNTVVNQADFDTDGHMHVLQRNGFTYIGLFPKTIYAQKTRYVNLLNLLNVLLSISLSVILFYLILTHLLRIKRLLRKFNVKIGGHQYANELDLLRVVFDDYNTVKREYDNLKVNVAYHSFLEALFLNGNSYNSLKFDHYIDFKYNCFCVGCFKILNIEKLSDESIFNYVYTVIQNIFEELINKVYRCYVTILEGKIIVLFNIDGERVENFYDYLSKNTVMANDIIRKNFDFEFLLYTSSVYTGVEAIPDAYNEVCNLLRFNYVDKNGEMSRCLISNDGMEQNQKVLTHEFFEKQKTLVKLIQCGDYKSAVAVLATIKDTYITKMNFEIVQIFIYNLLGEILKIIDDMETERTDLHYKELFGLIKSFGTSSEFFDTLSTFIERLCREIKSSKSRQRPRNDTAKQELLAEQNVSVQEMISNIIEYIDHNYADQNLNIPTIGEHFNIAPYYISNKFKSIMNISMADYINKVRVEKAKKIMEETDQTVLETAISVGFNNIRTFMRAFIKYESITPGKYKSINKK